jgi:hypothetical protein
MTKTLKDMMEARAGAAPGPQLDIDAMVRAGRRRVWRHRALGGAATGAVLAAALLVASSLHLVSDEPGISGSGAFGVRKAVTYTEDSTVHYGDQEITVPHEIRSFVQTDDGFVFTDGDATIYFTNGHETAAIGHGGGYTTLHVDDSGSYVAWIEFDEGELPELVVYDTSRGAEILRTSDGNGDGPGYLSDYDMPSVGPIDGDTLYSRNAKGVVAIDIASGESTVVIGPDEDAFLEDATGGWIAHTRNGDLTVSPTSGGTEIRLPNLEYGDLSPSGTAVSAYTDSRRPGRDDHLRVFDVATTTDVTPDWGDDYEYVGMVSWIDDATLVVYGAPGNRPVDLLRCSIRSGDCVVAVPSAGYYRGPGDFRLPSGGDPEGS